MKSAIRMFAAFACVPLVADFRAVPDVLAQTLTQGSRFLVILLCVCSLGFAADSKLERVKDKYHVIQVEAFEIQKGVDFPPELLSPLQDEVAKQLRESREFPEVLAAGGTPTNADAPVLRLTGILTHFKPGSRAKRYFGGYGAGSTEIFAQLTFIDRATGQTVLWENVRAVLVGGFLGGASSDVTKQFAHQVVDTIKLIGERGLPQPAQPVLAPSVPTSNPERPAGTEANPTPAAAVSAPLIGRHTVTISSDHFDDAEKKLSDEGAAGYHVVAFALTSNRTADVTLEKSAGDAPAYEYVLLHGYSPGGVEKRLNQKAGEGFRLIPQSFAQFRNGTALIAGRSAPSSSSRYQYKLHQTVRISSAQKDIERDQAQGYVLAATSNQNLHLVLLEKELTPASQ